MTGSRGGLSISATALLLGVPEPTIRSWERRYGVPLPSRTAGKHRRYTVDDLEQLREMRDAIAVGRRAKEAAEVVRRRALERGPGREHIASILDAAMRFDTTTVRSSLDAAEADLGLEQTIQVVVLPTMREIGSRWEAGKCDVSNEHLASHEVRWWLSARIAAAKPRSSSAQVVLACGPKDHHSLGLEAFHVILATRGWNCRVLGARVPTMSLLQALRATDARAVVVTSHLNTNRRSTVEGLRAMAEMTDLHLFYAGNAFATALSRTGVPGIYLEDDLTKAADIVGAALAGPH